MSTPTLESRLSDFKQAKKSGEDVLAAVEAKIGSLQAQASKLRTEIFANSVAISTVEQLLKDAASAKSAPDVAPPNGEAKN